MQHIHRILDSGNQTLLQQRLLENLQFEVRHLIQEHQQFPQKQYNRQQLNRLLQTISELEGESDVMEMVVIIEHTALQSILALKQTIIRNIALHI